MVMRFEVGTGPGVGHSKFETRGSTPGPPPHGFCFQQKSKRMIGLFLLHVPCSLCGSIKVKGINLVEDGRRLGRQAEFGDARGDGERRQEKEASQCDAASYLKCTHDPRPKKKCCSFRHCAGRV